MESYPSENCRVWNFESNLEDQHRIDDWDVKIYEAVSTILKKFGSYSFFATAGYSSHLRSGTDYTNIGESQSAGTWIYITGTIFSFGSIIGFSAKDNAIAMGIIKDGIGIKIYGQIVKNFSETVIYSDYITVNEWHYIAFSYDSTTNVFYLIIDNVVYNETPTGSWGSGTWYINIKASNATMKMYVDEVCFVHGQFIHPDTWIHHYNNNISWGAEYIP